MPNRVCWRMFFLVALLSEFGISPYAADREECRLPYDVQKSSPPRVYDTSSRGSDSAQLLGMDSGFKLVPHTRACILRCSSPPLHGSRSPTLHNSGLWELLRLPAVARTRALKWRTQGAVAPPSCPILVAALSWLWPFPGCGSRMGWQRKLIGSADKPRRLAVSRCAGERAGGGRARQVGGRRQPPGALLPGQPQHAPPAELRRRVGPSCALCTATNPACSPQSSSHAFPPIAGCSVCLRALRGHRGFRSASSAAREHRDRRFNVQ